LCGCMLVCFCGCVVVCLRGRFGSPRAAATRARPRPKGPPGRLLPPGASPWPSCFPPAQGAAAWPPAASLCRSPPDDTLYPFNTRRRLASSSRTSAFLNAVQVLTPKRVARAAPCAPVERKSYTFLTRCRARLARASRGCSASSAVPRLRGLWSPAERAWSCAPCLARQFTAICLSVPHVASDQTEEWDTLNFHHPIPA
jgi:hypothetical protein